MKKIIGKDQYHDGLTRVVYSDLSVDVTDKKIAKDIPNMWDIVEVINSKGLIETGNIKLLQKENK